MRQTKIICTMGPASDSPDILAALAKTMDVARFNFSHGTHEEQAGRLARVRAAAEKAGRPIAMLLDTKGPEIRTGLLENHSPVTLAEGDPFILTEEEGIGNRKKVSLSYKELYKDIKPGDTILIDDGLIGLTVEKVAGKDIHCTVSNGGVLGEQKGVNIPGVPIRLPSLTEQDIADIRFGMEQGFDFIAASFIRDASAVEDIRALLAEGNSPMKIIAKIESAEGVSHFDEIVDAADGIMIARGDLGVEVPARTLPHLQKEMIRKCNYKGKLVITATQMLDSMIRNPRPTRAEVTDVAAAVEGGTDAVMLSGETASGKYPEKALAMMASIVEYAEQFLEHNLFRYRDMEQSLYDSVSNTTSRASVTAAHELHARAIIAPTLTGNTASLLSKYRPDVDVFALSPNPAVVRQMMLDWGIYPVLAEREIATDDLYDQSIRKLKEEGLIKAGDICVITAGIPSNPDHAAPPVTNAMRIIQVQEDT